MTLDELTQRDRLIAELEAIPAARRTRAQQDELGRLLYNREQQWRRLPEAIERARAKARNLETYARQIGLPLQLENHA